MRVTIAHRARPEQFALLVRQHLEELRHGPIDWRRHWDPMVVDASGKRRPANSLIAHRQWARERVVLVNDDKERASLATRRVERHRRAELANQASGGRKPTLPRRGRPQASLARAGQTIVDVPNLYRFWDVEANGDRDPAKIGAQSTKPVGHEAGDPDGRWPGHLHQWEQTPASRARSDADCPFCMRQRACRGTCLRTTHPKLASEEEWDYPTNAATRLTPDNVLFGSKKVAARLCRRHGPYKMVIQYQATRGQGCKQCAIEEMTRKRHETLNRIRRERHALAVEVRARRAAQDPSGL